MGKRLSRSRGGFMGDGLLVILGGWLRGGGGRRGGEWVVGG